MPPLSRFFTSSAAGALAAQRKSITRKDIEMEENASKVKKTGLAGRVAIALIVLAIALAAAAALLFTVPFAGWRCLRTDYIDARLLRLDAARYEAAAAQYPGESVRWRVPVGDKRFDSFSEELVISSLPEEDVDMLLYFPELRRIDASSCTDSAALAAAARLLPAVDIVWSVDSSAGPIDGNTRTLAVESIRYDELRALLPLLPRLEELDLSSSTLSAQEREEICAEFDALRVSYPVRFWGLELPGDSTELFLPEGAGGDIRELESALGMLPRLERADLSAVPLTAEELREILPLCPEDTDYAISLCGLVFPGDSEEIDLSGTPVSDVSGIESALEVLPRLKKVVMSDCGVSDEEMDALDRRHEDVKFVWTVYFSVYALRTDATVFCASDLPWLNYLAPELNDAQIAPLRYCHELEALDLGHMWFSDLSFLYEMPHLRYLILVEGRFHDITPIGSLEDLEYLEIFMNRIDDISPLLNCKKLRHLNICYTYGYDQSPLYEMTWLERLWYCGLGPQKGERLAAALPDTVVYYPYTDPDGSTGGGWREVEAYFEMRDVFGMYYQPGGTGIH